MNLLKIKELCEHKNGGLKRLAEEIGMSEQNLHRCINNNKIQAGDLEKIAHSFNVSISIFFEDQSLKENINVGHNVNGNGNNILGNISLNEMQKELDHLRQLLQEKQAIIDEKERTIQILLNK